MIFFRWAVLFGCLLMVAPKQSFSQSQDQQDEMTIRIDVNLIQVDVVVTDSKGRAVSDLKAEDFTILQDGKPQKITNFSYIHTDAPGPLAIEDERASLKPGKDLEKLPAPAAPMPALKQSEVRRTIALVVDDLGLSFPSVVRVRESLRKWLDKDMRPGDMVGVLMTGGGMGSLQQFTADKRLLRAAIDGVKFNTMGRVGSSSFSAIGNDLYLSAAAENERQRGLAFGSVGAIQSAINGLRNISGRKSVILFSENLGIMFGEENDYLMQQYMLRLSDEAIRSGVVIHAIDPRGVVYTGFTAEDRLGDLGAADFGNALGSRLQSYLDSQDGMVIMTKRTGGLFIQNDNNIARALQEVVRDGDNYYLLGYQPDDKIVEEMKSDNPKFHPIKVRANRRGLRVRTRPGFFSAPDAPREPTTIPGRISRALYSPFDSGTLEMRLTALFARTKNDKSCINALLHFDTKGLTFVEESDGWRKASINITAATFDAGGQAIDFKDLPWSLMARGETYESMLENGVTFLMRVPVKEAGAYQMRIVLCDMVSGVIGSARQFIEIPDVRKNRLALSGIVLGAQRFDPEAGIERAEGVLATEDVESTPAIRIFEQGESVAWAYQVLNAKANKKHHPELQSYIRLFHEGREIYTGEPSKMAMSTSEIPERLIASGRMQMKKIPRGDYAFQVIVADTSKEKKQRVAAQSIDFQIR